MSTRSERIRALNDELRQHLLGGGAVITPSIVALGPEAVKRLVHAISLFDDFCKDNDPWDERDFGILDFEGTEIMFRIEYYCNDFRGHSPDPSDPSVTERVITIMRSSEY